MKALKNVQWVYLATAIFTFGLAAIFYFSTIPEITDADMEYQAEESGMEVQPFRKQYRLFHAALAQFCYCGGQVAVASFFINYVTETRANTSSALGAKFLAGAQGAFAVGRFFGVVLMKYVRPRYVFLAFFTCVMVFTAPTITKGGNTGMSLLYMVLFFESICFPTIVALGMRGLGRHTKRGSGWIVAGVIGGACAPPLTGRAADINNNTAKAMAVPLAFFICAWSYPLCINFVPSYRDTADKFSETEVGLTNASSVDVKDEEKGVMTDGTEKNLYAERLEAKS